MHSIALAMRDKGPRTEKVSVDAPSRLLVLEPNSTYLLPDDFPSGFGSAAVPVVLFAEPVLLD